MTTARFAVLSIALVCAALRVPADAQTVRPALLTVTGHATLVQAPDRTRVTFAIRTTDAASARATSANAGIANALATRLGAIGVPAGAIATSGYALGYVPRPSRPDPANDQRYGFTVTRTIDVTVDGIDRAGAIVDAGVAAGVTDVEAVSFLLRDPEAAQRRAQTAAVADALAQARALADAAGQRLVRIRAITTGTPPSRVLPLVRTMSVAAAVPTTIDPGNLTVDASVTLEVEIAPTRAL